MAERIGIIHGSGTFETGDLTGFNVSGNEPEVVSAGHPVHTSIYSMRAYLHRTESGNAYRTMVRVQADDEAEPGVPLAVFQFTIGNEYWIGFSVHIQEDLIADPVGLSDVVFQIQAYPDAGETYRSPCICLAIDTVAEGEELVNHWRIWRLWDTRASSPGMDWEYGNWHQLMLEMGDDVGAWTDWVFHIVFDYHNNGDGLLQAWRNGVQVLDVNGGNCSNDSSGPYPSFGCYKWPWRPSDPYETNSEWRLFYFDEFRIGDVTSDYDSVAPGGAPEPPPPPPPEVTVVGTLGVSSYKLRLKSAAGVLVAEVTDFETLCYAKRVNAPGLCTFTLDGDHAAIDLLEHKSQVEIWRRNLLQEIDWHCDYYGLHLSPGHAQTERGVFTAICPGQMWFLGTRIIAWYAATADRTAFTSDPAETIMKTLVDYNACANATTGNGRLRDGAITGLSIQADGANGNTLDWNCTYKNLLAELQDLAQVGSGDFDLVKTAAQAWQFRWYTGQRGTDRRSTVIFARERGNMINPRYRHDRISEKTVAIVGGQGEEDERDIEVRTGDDYSAANNVEVFVDARNRTVTAGYNAAGDKRLSELQAREEFTWKVVQTPACFYGEIASGGDYELGDLVTARAFDIEREHKIVGVTVTVVPAADSCETIDIEVETPVTAP